MELKPIPPITWQNLIPPNLDHDYFQNSQYLPFQAHSTQFSLVNAWWLSEASLLAYAEPDFARPRFVAAGFGLVRFFSARATQCYLVEADRFRILVFRGTQTALFQAEGALAHFWADLCADLDARFTEDPLGGFVHRGFQTALDEVWSELLPCLSGASDRPLWVTGHSLGGALATLAAVRSTMIHGLYTFGSPRVGDRTFVERFRMPAFRFVHYRDGVPVLPPAPYRHAGQLCYLDGRGKIVTAAYSTQITVQEGEFRRRADLMQRCAVLKGSGRKSAGSSAALVPRFLRDHMPLLYALHIWNNLVSASRAAI